MYWRNCRRSCDYDLNITIFFPLHISSNVSLLCILFLWPWRKYITLYSVCKPVKERQRERAKKNTMYCKPVELMRVMVCVCVFFLLLSAQGNVHILWLCVWNKYLLNEFKTAIKYKDYIIQNPKRFRFISFECIVSHTFTHAYTHTRMILWMIVGENISPPPPSLPQTIQYDTFWASQKHCLFAITRLEYQKPSYITNRSAYSSSPQTITRIFIWWLIMFPCFSHS